MSSTFERPFHPDPTFKPQKDESIEKETLLAEELERLLERNQPDTFGPEWISQQDRSLWNQMQNFMRAEQGKVDWSKIVDLLNVRWKARWKMRPREWGRTPEQEIGSLAALLDTKNPDYFGPGWIRANDYALYTRLTRGFVDERKRVDWQKIMGSLNHKWRSRWQQPTEKGRSLRAEVDSLMTLLEEKNPIQFGPAWIIANDHALYQRIQAVARDEKDRLDWSKITDSLDEKWRSKWKRQSTERGRTLQEELRSLEILLDAKNPASFNPRWIVTNDRPLYERLFKFVSNERLPGQGDWSKVVNLLDDKWKTRWKTQEKQTTLKEDIENLLVILRAKKPDTFDPWWIAKNDSALYRRLRYKIRDEYGKPDWSRVYHFLDEPWKDAWGVKESEHSLQEEVVALDSLLVSKNPFSFGQKWIYDNDPGLYTRLRNKIRDSHGKLGWLSIIGFLDTSWQTRWQRPEEAEQADFDQIQQLTALLVLHEPSSFGPKWIAVNAPSLYSRLRNTIRDDGGNLNWSKILNSLDEKWRSRWTRKLVEITSLEKDIEDLKLLLKKYNPSSIGPVWIMKADADLYARMLKKVRKNEGRSDWSKIVNQLEDVWKKRWKQRAFFKEPVGQYLNDDEVTAVLELHRNKLYTFLSILKPEDKKERDVICSEMLQLARKGNISAENKLVALLSPQVQEWMDVYPEFAVYRHDPESVDNRIRRCIYLSDLESQKSFVGYLLKSLQFQARGLKHQVAQSLDQPMGDDDRTLLDRLSIGAANEDVSG